MEGYPAQSKSVSPTSQRSLSSNDYVDNAKPTQSIRHNPIRMNLRTLLLNYPKGVLPSSVPGLYRQLFKLNLDLSAQDLEEELVGLGAEIAGEIWPGERVYALRPSLSSALGSGI